MAASQPSVLWPNVGDFIGYIFDMIEGSGVKRKKIGSMRYFGKVLHIEAKSPDKHVAVIRFNDPNDNIPQELTLCTSKFKTTDLNGWDLCAPTDEVMRDPTDEYPPFKSSGTVPEGPYDSDDTEEGFIHEEHIATSFSDFMSHLMSNQEFLAWLNKKIDERIAESGLGTNNLKEIIIKRSDQPGAKNLPCAWSNKYPNREHKSGNACHFVPLAVFASRKFKFAEAYKNDPSQALTDCRALYGVCKHCRHSVSDTPFYDADNRAGLCAICKSVANVAATTGLPVCANCTKSAMDGNMDKDWRKGFFAKLLGPIKHFYPDLNIVINPEDTVVRDAPEGMVGNHNKRIDLTITMDISTGTSHGHTMKRKVAIAVEIDNPQKPLWNNDEIKLSKLKVKHIKNKYNPYYTFLWRVNFKSVYETSNSTIPLLDMYERGVVFRSWLLFIIENVMQFPRMNMWTFWYDQPSLNKIRNSYKEEDRPFIHNILVAPHDPGHAWRYCIDPIEGGARFGKENDEKSNPFSKIFDSRRTFTDVFGGDNLWPVKNNYPFKTFV